MIMAAPSNHALCHSMSHRIRESAKFLKCTVNISVYICETPILYDGLCISGLMDIDVLNALELERFICSDQILGIFWRVLRKCSCNKMLGDNEYNPRQIYKTYLNGYPTLNEHASHSSINHKTHRKITIDGCSHKLSPTFVMSWHKKWRGFHRTHQHCS